MGKCHCVMNDYFYLNFSSLFQPDKCFLREMRILRENSLNLLYLFLQIPTNKVFILKYSEHSPENLYLKLLIQHLVYIENFGNKTTENRYW